MGFAASDAGDRRGEEVFQLENAAWSRDELVGRHAAYRALMHLDGSRDVAQDQRPKMLDSMQEEAVLLAHDLAGDAKDRRRPLVQRLDQRSEERRVGTEWGSQGRSRWLRDH